MSSQRQVKEIRKLYRFQDQIDFSTTTSPPWRGNWITFTAERFDAEKTYRQKTGLKPNGLWFGLGLNWYQSQIYSGNLLRFMYKVTPKDDVIMKRAVQVQPQDTTTPTTTPTTKKEKKQIIVLQNRADLEAFHSRFADPRFAAFFQDEHGQIFSVVIQWALVKKEFSGILLKDPQLMPGWDIASGCIWDLSCVHVQLLGQLKNQVLDSVF